MTPKCSECRRQAIVLLIAAKGPPGVPLPFCARHALLHIQGHAKDDDLIHALEKARHRVVPATDIEFHLANMISAGQPFPMWGGVEAFELQALILLELRYGGGERENRFLQTYGDFIRPRHPELGNRLLSGLLQDHAVIAQTLRAFRDHLHKLETTT